MGKHVVVVGAGNIGSYTCDLLARIEQIEQITLVDPDVYTAENVAAQSISRADVGRVKCVVQARRLRRLRPGLRVVSIAARVEDVPWGRLRADLLCACLDSRASRLTCNEIAWRLGMPWIDSGVSGGGLLARVSVFVPSPDSACFECGLSDEHYATMEVAYPCKAGMAADAPSSGAPAYLGALAAALQAAECQKLLLGRAAESLAGREVVVDTRHHQHYVTKLTRNAACRFDHETFLIEPARLRSGLRVREVFALGGPTSAAETITLSAPGRRFVRTRPCSACGTGRSGWRLASDGMPAPARCPQCASPVAPEPFGVCPSLPATAVDSGDWRRSLRTVGFRAGDIVTVTGPAGARHFELAGSHLCSQGDDRGPDL